MQVAVSLSVHPGLFGIDDQHLSGWLMSWLHFAANCETLEQLCSRSSPAIYLFCRRPTISTFLNEHLLGSTFSSLIYILSPPPFPRIFSVQTERSAYILGREKVAEGEIGSDEFMRERGQSDSSYYHGADGERLSLRRICFRFNE